MSLQSIGAVASEPQPLPDQKNRSSVNFQFNSVPSSGDIATVFTAVAGAAAITATLMHDIGGGNDIVVTSLAQGVGFAGNLVQTGANYYIAAPQNAAANFVTYFQDNA